MTDESLTRPHLEGLIRKWREDSERVLKQRKTVSQARGAYCQALLLCAEQLQAALAAPPAEAPAERGDDFAAWWLKNVPSGTVISNPEWWLTRIRRFMAAAPAAPAEGWAPPLQGDDSAPWPTFPLDTHYNTRVSMRYGQFCNLILATAPRVTGGRDSERMDFVEMSCLLCLDSVSGEPGGNGQRMVAATRKNIDAALQAATGGAVGNG